VRAVELLQPQLVGLEEVADAGQRVAAQPGLLIEHGGQQVVRRAHLALGAEDGLALPMGLLDLSRADLSAGD